MIKAGALYYTIIIMLIVFSLCTFIILSSFYRRQSIESQIHEEQLDLNVNSGINLLLVNNYIVKPDALVPYEIFANEKPLLLIHKQWGAYEINGARTSWKRRNVEKIGMAGYFIPFDSIVALYMQDLNNYLSITGETRLKGNCYIPKLGIRASYVEGKSYTAKELVFGKIFTSKNSLPEINSEILKFCKKYLTRAFSEEDSVVTLPATDYFSVNNSFFNKTLIYVSDNSLNFDHCNFTGNIILISSDSMVIQKQNLFKDVIIIAPKVRISGNFRGSFQIIASDTVIVEKGSCLEYPSSVLIFPQTFKTDITGFLSVDEHVNIFGCVALINSAGNNNKGKVLLNKGSLITGQVYCNSNIEMLDSVVGSLYTSRFIIETSRAYYENHLMDAVISGVDISKYFIFPELIPHTKKEIIKWVN